MANDFSLKRRKPLDFRDFGNSESSNMKVMETDEDRHTHGAT